MRLLWTTDYWGPDAPGGSAESIRLLAHGVQALGHIVTILTPNWHGTLPDRTNLYGLDVRAYPLRHLLPAGQNLARTWVPGFDRATARAVAALAPDYDFVHAQDRRVLPSTVHGVYRAGRPVAFTARDVGLLCPIVTCLLQQRTIPADCGQRKLWRECGPWYQRHYDDRRRTTPLKHALRYWRLQMTRQLSCRLAFVGFVSKGLWAVYRERGWPSCRTVVLPSPVETTSIAPASRFPEVSFFGRPSIGKGWPTFQEAVRALDLPAEQVVHVHGLPRAAALWRMCETGVVAVPPLQCDALPRVALEAQAFGKPVVATRVGGLPEIVEDGVTGLLVEPSDAQGLAAAIGRLFNDSALASQMGEAGRKRMHRLFSPEVCARRLIEAYEGQ